MKEEELLSKKMILVKMNEIAISTLEKPIIGTQALATCVGLLLYSPKEKRAIVAHVSNDVGSIITETLDLIDRNNLIDDSLKYKVIPGYYENHYKIANELENFYKACAPLFIPFNEDEITDNAIRIDEGTKSVEFAFNALTGEFVTNKVLFGKDYIDASGNEKNFNKK